MSRSSAEVVQQLLDELGRIVTVYPEGVERTGMAVAELIAGTSFFPGGTGLWRGDISGGDMPVVFPEKPIMFVGHNFDSITAHAAAQRNKGEVKTKFWNTLKDFLRCAGLDPSDCFFTNALMGLKPGSATGPMPPRPDHRRQCQHFLLRQIEIVNPRALVTLGGDSEKQRARAFELSRSRPRLSHRAVMHPSTRPFQRRPNDAEWLKAQAALIRELL